MRLCKEAMRTQLHPLAKNSEINLHRTSSGAIKMRIMALHGGEKVAPLFFPVSQQEDAWGPKMETVCGK